MFGARLLRSLLGTASPIEAYLDMNLDKEVFQEDEYALFAYVRKHIVTHSVFPDESTLAEAYKEGLIPLLPDDTAPEPPSYYYDRMVERHFHVELKNALFEAQTLLNQKSPMVALEVVKETAMRLTTKKYRKNVVNFSKDSAELVYLEYSKKAKQGDNYGLQLGWPTVDEMSGGLIGGDVVSIIGRPAMGKTWMMLFSALNAFKHGGVPLFVSMEIKPLPLIQRMAAMLSHKSIYQLKHASLNDKSLKNMLAQLKALQTGLPFWIVDGALAATVSDIELLARQYNPSAIFIDGAYLLKHENPKVNRWERVTDNAERIKGELAESLNVPVVISYQFNRESVKKKHGPATVADVAYTDAIGQLSSLVLGIMQQESVETLLEREIDILKGRSGEVGKFKINWLFDEVGGDYMNFTEKKKFIVEDLKYI